MIKLIICFDCFTCKVSATEFYLYMSLFYYYDSLSLDRSIDRKDISKLWYLRSLFPLPYHNVQPTENKTGFLITVTAGPHISMVNGYATFYKASHVFVANLKCKMLTVWCEINNLFFFKFIHNCRLTIRGW